MSSFESVINGAEMQVCDQLNDTDKPFDGIVKDNPLDNNETKTINKCICAFFSSSPYDTSVFPNNATTYYTQVENTKIGLLTDLLEKANSLDKTYDMNMLYVSDCFSDPNIEIIFRFLCSPECHDGLNFVSKQITDEVYKFIKFVTSKRPVLIEVSDHSMASIFNNWSENLMAMPSPIVIDKETTHGLFKMEAKKDVFLSSTHPTLKQIGDMSASDDIEISFHNMGGTKIFSVVDSVAELCNLKVLSTGMSCENVRLFGKIGEKDDKDQDSTKDTTKKVMPVHCEFDYGMGKFVVSATHWCNLNEVDTPIDLPTLRRYCTDVLGADATAIFDYSLSSAVTENEIKREISYTVRGISSGGSSIPKKKLKVGSNSLTVGKELDDNSVADKSFPELLPQLSKQKSQALKTFDELNK
jgi:hypothetical protein